MVSGAAGVVVKCSGCCEIRDGQIVPRVSFIEKVGAAEPCGAGAHWGYAAGTPGQHTQSSYSSWEIVRKKSG